MNEFDGHTAVVTGAGRGIGASTVLLLASQGAKVVAAARSRQELDDLVDQVRADGGAAVAVAVDLADAGGVSTLAERCVAELGTVDIVVNNVGGSNPGRLRELSDDDWQRALDLNLLSAVRLTTALLPNLRVGRASIINVASTSGREPDKIVAPYAAAKAALISYSKACADDLARDGIRVNCVLPGIIETSATVRNAALSAERTGKTAADVMTAMLERHPIPLGRLGRPEDIAETIAFLASQRSAFITGATLYADGGAHRGA